MTERPKQPYWDDDTEPDRLWIDTIFTSYSMHGTHGNVELTWITVASGERVLVSINGNVAHGIRTKGQIRKVCNALEIPILWKFDPA